MHQKAHGLFQSDQMVMYPLLLLVLPYMLRDVAACMSELHHYDRRI